MRKFESLVLAALLTGLAGCGPGSTELSEAARAAASPVSAKWKAGRLDIDVPAPVITFGMSEQNVAALRAELQPHQVDHDSIDLNQTLPPDLEEGQENPTALLPLFGETITLPVLPTAHYAVSAAPPALEQQFVAALAAAKLEEGLYDANAIEDFLAGALPAHGFGINPDAPSIVVLHLTALGVRDHGWKIQGPTGFLQPVRVFGERHPMIVLDPSARPDSYAGSGGYKSPAASGAAAVIAEFVREATEYRVLQGSIYPVAQAPCHAVTALLGIRRNTSLSEALLREVEDAFNAGRIKASFDHLTGTDVFFDVKILSLPQDDPVLDAIARGEFPAFEVLRGYLSVMFDQYHVDHAGCEEYLSVVFAGDVATVPGGGVLGIGTYDVSAGHRISMSWVHELFRFTFDPESPICRFGCTGKDYLNWWEYLFSHETGHLLGQRHPHDITSRSSGSGSSDAFSSIWSSMSYQQDGRMIDFGKIDANNWRRNRAGYALKIASDNGREGSPAWKTAMDKARQLDWQGVWQALQQ